MQKMGLENNKFTNKNREVLYKLLYNKTDLSNRYNECYDNLKSYLEYLIMNYVISKDEFKLYRNAKRIVIKQEKIRLSGSILGLTSCPSYDFPNSIVTIEEPFDPNKRITVQGIIYFSELDTPMFFENTDKIIKYSYDTIVKDIINKIPKDKLDILKEYFLKLLKIDYYIANFLIDYFEHPSDKRYYVNYNKFLSKVKTWKALKKINPEWFELLVEYYKKDSDNSEIDKDPLEEKNLIENKLKDLKYKLNL